MFIFWLFLPEVFLTLITLFTFIIVLFKYKKYTRSFYKLTYKLFQIFSPCILISIFFCYICLDWDSIFGEKQVQMLLGVWWSIQDYIIFDTYALIFRFLILILGFLVFLLFKAWLEIGGKAIVWEIPFFMMAGLIFMLILVSSWNLLTFFISMEGLSVCLYLIISAAAKNPEAAFKYFTFSAFASGLFIFGMWCFIQVLPNYSFLGIYYYLFDVGNLGLLHKKNPELLKFVVPLISLLLGFLFKLAAFPNHFWVNDIYVAFSTPVLAYFALPVKVCIFSIFLRLLSILIQLQYIWQEILIYASIGSLFFGSILVLRARTIHQFIAGSSVNHMGFMLSALTCHYNYGFTAAIVHLINYVIMAIVFFFILILYRGLDNSTPIIMLQDLRWIKNDPTLALIMTIVCLSFAGVPPFAGFFSKWFILKALILSKRYILLIIFVVVSGISAFYYLKIVKYVNFTTILRKDSSKKKTYFYNFLSHKNNNTFRYWINFLIWYLILFIFFYEDFFRGVTYMLEINFFL